MGQIRKSMIVWNNSKCRFKAGFLIFPGYSTSGHGAPDSSLTDVPYDKWLDIKQTDWIKCTLIFLIF
jgi:hypothetical protein